MYQARRNPTTPSPQYSETEDCDARHCDFRRLSLRRQQVQARAAREPEHSGAPLCTVVLGSIGWNAHMRCANGYREETRSMRKCVYRMQLDLPPNITCLKQ
jgi:hypothetical protein